MFWTVVLAATASTAAPIDALVLARIAGPEVAEAPSTPQLQTAAEDAARLFTDVAVRPRASVPVSDAALRPCGPDVGCLADALEGSGVGRVVFVIVNHAESPPLVTVEVLDTRARRVLASKYAAGEDAIEVLARVVEEGLVASGHALGARVTVDVTPSHATAFLDERPVTDVVHGVAPGLHRLVVSAEDYETAERVLDLAPGAREHVSVTLEEASPITSKWWFWTAIAVAAAGVTVAGLAAGGVIGSDDLCLGGGDACR